MSFTIETEQNNKMSFLYVNGIREQVKFTTNVHRKLTFSSVYTHFHSFLLYLAPTKPVLFTH